jgi:hypothetical protein
MNNNCLFDLSRNSLQPTAQDITSYSARLIDVADSVLESETETDVKLEVRGTKASPIYRAALEFYALRRGVTVAEYCQEAIARCLQMDEDQSEGSFS